MALRMTIIGSRDHPVVVCDHCGAEIDSARAGYYCWKYDTRDGSLKGDVSFIHRECEPAFTRTRGDYAWSVKELDCLPVELVQRLGIKWNEALEKVLKLDPLHD